MKTNMIIIAEFLKRPVAYQPILAKVFGSVNLGIFWSQMYYWNGKGSDKEGWIYKTQKEIYDETALSRREQETARKIGRELGVVEEKLAGQPATVHFRINIEQAMALIERYLMEQSNGKLPLKMPKKEKITSSMSYLKDIPTKDLEELSEKYEVGQKFILATAEDVIDYCEAKGKSYKDYKAALRNFIKSSIKRNPDEQKHFREDRRKREQDDTMRRAEEESGATPQDRAGARVRVTKMKQAIAKSIGV